MTSEFERYQQHMLRQMAESLGIPYETIVGPAPAIGRLSSLFERFSLASAPSPYANGVLKMFLELEPNHSPLCGLPFCEPCWLCADIEREREALGLKDARRSS
jgi:hypothetical protein